MSHDYSNQSTEEDPRMMAFFDSLVQRELEGWSTDDSTHDSESGINYQPFVVRGDTSDDSNSDTLSNHSLHSGDEEGGLSPFTMAFAIAMVRRARQTEDGNDDGDADRPEDILDVRSSFMERLDELNNDGDGEGSSSSSSALPGQRPNSARKSITELINQKRKEYLIKAKNDKVAMKRKASETKHNKIKTATNIEGASTSGSSSDSSSSSSSSSDSHDESGEDSEKEKSNKKNNTKKKVARSKRKAKKSKVDLGVKENHGAESNHNAADVIKELEAERDKMKSRLKRLKVMRSRALLDLSNSSDSDAGASTSQSKHKCSDVSAADGGNQSDGNVTESKSQSCEVTSLSANNEERVNENGLERDLKVLTSRNTATGMIYNVAKPDPDICDNSTKESILLKDVQNGNVPNGAPATVSDNPDSCPKKPPFSTFCQNETTGSVTNSVNGHTASANGHCNSLNDNTCLINGNGSTVSNGASTSNVESLTTDSEPVWTHFKRFRNRVEKAHRHYRKSASHRDNSGCSSGEES